MQAFGLAALTERPNLVVDNNDSVEMTVEEMEAAFNAAPTLATIA